MGFFGAFNLNSVKFFLCGLFLCFAVFFFGEMLFFALSRIIIILFPYLSLLIAVAGGATAVQILDSFKAMKWHGQLVRFIFFVGVI